jgi:cytochrome c oxidase assembly factor CtaG
MTNGQLFAQAWDFEPTVIFGSAALFFAYLWLVRFRMNRKTALFGSGVLLMLLTLIGPLDFLGDNYLFSAHMMEHILLYLAVPPLLLLGLPQAVPPQADHCRAGGSGGHVALAPARAL